VAAWFCTACRGQVKHDTLATQEGAVGIDYLDIVSVRRQSSSAEKRSVWLRSRRVSQHSKSYRHAS